MPFAGQLIELRQSGDHSQKAVALGIGVSTRQYQRYESGGQEPTLSVIIKLCHYFNVSADYLLGLSDDPERR
jgi:transcriptional regulator with XRE-family HTH domain